MDPKSKKIGVDKLNKELGTSVQRDEREIEKHLMLKRSYVTLILYEKSFTHQQGIGELCIYNMEATSFICGFPNMVEIEKKSILNMTARKCLVAPIIVDSQICSEKPSYHLSEVEDEVLLF